MSYAYKQNWLQKRKNYGLKEGEGLPCNTGQTHDTNNGLTAPSGRTDRHHHTSQSGHVLKPEGN